MTVVLFPEGGGQPSDVGTMQIIPEPAGAVAVTTAPENTIQVRQVLRRQLEAIHYCDAPVPAGTQVRVQLDVEGRTDRMAQHTGQHVSVMTYKVSLLVG